MANERRLIDGNEVERKLKIAISSWLCDCNSNAPVIARAMKDALQRVIYAPTVDAAEVVHGEWGEIYTCHGERLWGYRCSECEADNANKSNYCPNCGAKMDG